MQITERAFSAKTFRPKPGCHISENQELAAVITPWGQSSLSTAAVFEDLESRYSFFSEDLESTRPFPLLQNLSVPENDVRTAIIQVNQGIYHKINEEEYSTGFELFCAAITGNVCVFSQVGCPVVLIDKPQHSLCLVGSLMTDRASLCNSKEHQPSLPVQLLGVHEDVSITSGYFEFSKGDRLILLSRSYVPPAWLSVKREERTIEYLSRLASRDNPQIPFWLGILTL